MKKYKYIFTDLDGTLYSIYPEPFTKLYKESLINFFNDNGYDGQKEAEVLISAFYIMRNYDNVSTVEELFYKHILPYSKIDRETYEKLLHTYYDSKYYTYCKSVSSQNKNMQEVIKILIEKNYKIFLTTNPVFYKQALEKRIEWAGLNPNIFEEITCLENYHYTKPHKEYFLEVCKNFNLNPKDILMLGNDTTDDTQTELVGIDCYIITDSLINRSGKPISTTYSGTSEELLNIIKNEF